MKAYIIKYTRLALFVLLAGIFCLAATGREGLAAAKKDTKKPTIKVTLQSEKPTNQDLLVTIKVSDKSGISTVKWSANTKSLAYFTKNGSKIKLKNGSASVIVTKNGTYTFYAKDKAGNAVRKVIKVSNIDKTLPVLKASLSTQDPTNQNVELKITASDKDSGIAGLYYLEGKKKATDFKKGVPGIKLKAGKGNYIFSKNSTITLLLKDNAGNQRLQTVTVSNIDRKAPVLKAEYRVMNQTASITASASDQETEIRQLKYIRGNVTDVNASKWDEKGKTIANNSFKVKSSGKYSIMAEDSAGNRTITAIDVTLEMRAVWISYLDFQKFYYKQYEKNLGEANFRKSYRLMLENCIKNNMNTVIVQVRPYGDAYYPSGYFPWSADLTGAQGKNPGFDPLKIMVEEAHKKGLEFHAWLNPYRVTLNTTSLSKLSKDNPAVKWLNSADKNKQRNVLKFDGKIYYNPAKAEVQNLIVNGVMEIVKNYDVDGIHFDDYFYPTLGANYKTNFDAPEYEAYKKTVSSPKTIVKWRQDNVNTLLKKIHSAIKKEKPRVVFGVSPQGNMSNLASNQGHYTDVLLWMSSDQYIDYICPQIYWSFDHPTAAYDKMVKQWINARTGNKVNLYIGIAAYKAGISRQEAVSLGDSGWADSRDVLKREIQYGRDTGIVDGYMFFRYEFLISSKTAKEMSNLRSVLN